MLTNTERIHYTINDPEKMLKGLGIDLTEAFIKVHIREKT